MNLNSEIYEKIIESIKIGDIKETQNNLEKAKFTVVEQYFNKEDKYGLKPIHWACLTSNMEILEWMLQEKCDIESSSRNGWRPIHFASFIGNERMIAFLIENSNSSCKLDCKTDNGETVLDVANGDCNHEFINEILNENSNLKIGLSMGLKCEYYCDHEFCLKSLIRPEYYLIERNKSKASIKVTDSYNDRTFAMKITERRDYDEYEIKKCIGLKINEILPNLDNSKIIKYYGLIKAETKMILFTEWMDNGSLWNKFRQIETRSNATIYQYCNDILQAIAFLHDNKILHRFIHPKKIFIDNNGECKLVLSNYSYSLADGDVQIDDDWLRKYLKYSFAAPELVKNGILTYPYDIWLFGCTIIGMLTGNRLNYQSIEFDEIEKIITKIPNEMLQSFVRNMVMEDPTERSTANELLNHEFMRNNNYLSIFDNSLINRKNSIYLIQNAIDDKKK